MTTSGKNWRIEYKPKVYKDIKRLSKTIQTRIKTYIETHLLDTTHPRQFGKALRGDKHDVWRYRMGDYRLLAQLQDDTHTIVLLRIIHRKEAYR